MYLCSALFFSFHTRQQIGFSVLSVGDILLCVFVKDRDVLKCAKTKRTTTTTNSFFHIFTSWGAWWTTNGSLTTYASHVRTLGNGKILNFSIVYYIWLTDSCYSTTCWMSIRLQRINFNISDWYFAFSDLFFVLFVWTCWKLLWIFWPNFLSAFYIYVILLKARNTTEKNI